MKKRKLNLETLPDLQAAQENDPKIRINKENTEAYQPPRNGIILLEVLITLFFIVK